MQQKCCEKCVDAWKPGEIYRTGNGNLFCKNPKCNCHTSQQKAEGWELKFDKKFGVHVEGQWTNENLPRIKDFIRSLLSQQSLQHQERVRALIDSIPDVIENQYYDECDLKTLKQQLRKEWL